MVKLISKIADKVAKLYPFTPKSFATPSGARMSFVDEGPRQDVAVLMLHGNPTWSFFYRDLIRDLSPNIRCIAPDHIGMGLSDKPQHYDYTLDNRIKDIEALIKTLDLKLVHLVVHDWGGASGFGFAARHPELIGKITILNTAAFVSDQIPWRISICRVPILGKLLVRGLNGFAAPAVWMSMNQRKLSKDEQKGYLLPYSNWDDRVAVNAFVQDIPLELNHPSRPTLAFIEQNLSRFKTNPKLIVWGGRDFCFNDHFRDRWLKIFPGTTVHYFPDCGHYILDDGGAPVRSKVSEFVLGA